MNDRLEPLISHAELEALTNHRERGQVDVHYPLRVWYLIGTCALYAVALILSSRQMASFLASDHTMVDRLESYLFFRGWFVVGVTLFGVWAYARAWRVKSVFWTLFYISLTNLISDLFIVYPERLSHPTAGFLLLFTMRLLAIVALYVSAKNTHRMPDASQRFNVFMLLRHTPCFDRRRRHHNPSHQ